MLFEKLYNKLNKPLFVENPITNIYKSYHVKKALYNPIDSPDYLFIFSSISPLCRIPYKQLALNFSTLQLS